MRCMSGTGSAASPPRPLRDAVATAVMVVTCVALAALMGRSTGIVYDDVLRTHGEAFMTAHGSGIYGDVHTDGEVLTPDATPEDNRAADAIAQQVLAQQVLAQQHDDLLLDAIAQDDDRPHPLRSLAASRVPDVAGMASASDLQKIYHQAGLLVPGGRPKSVAVVGSSGNLLYRGYGPEIDEHDVVIRANGATTAGYEHDVGRARYQFVVCWYTGCHDAYKRHQLTNGAMAIVSSNGYSRGSLPWEAHSAARAYLSPDWMKKQHNNLKQAGAGGSWPSTGWLALTFGVALGRHFNARISIVLVMLYLLTFSFLAYQFWTQADNYVSLAS